MTTSTTCTPIPPDQYICSGRGTIIDELTCTCQCSSPYYVSLGDLSRSGQTCNIYLPIFQTIVILSAITSGILLLLSIALFFNNMEIFNPKQMSCFNSTVTTATKTITIKSPSQLQQQQQQQQQNMNNPKPNLTKSNKNQLRIYSIIGGFIFSISNLIQCSLQFSDLPSHRIGITVDSTALSICMGIGIVFIGYSFVTQICTAVLRIAGLSKQSIWRVRLFQKFVLPGLLFWFTTHAVSTIVMLYTPDVDSFNMIRTIYYIIAHGTLGIFTLILIVIVVNPLIYTTTMSLTKLANSNNNRDNLLKTLFRLKIIRILLGNVFISMIVTGFLFALFEYVGVLASFDLVINFFLACCLFVLMLLVGYGSTLRLLFPTQFLFMKSMTTASGNHGGGIAPNKVSTIHNNTRPHTNEDNNNNNSTGSDVKSPTAGKTLPKTKNNINNYTPATTNVGTSMIGSSMAVPSIVIMGSKIDDDALFAHGEGWEGANVYNDKIRTDGHNTVQWISGGVSNNV
jgi:hypothetical protein